MIRRTALAASIALIAITLPAFAQDSGTLKKIDSSGSRVGYGSRI